MKNLLVAGARDQLNRAALSAATSAGMAVTGALHTTDIEQGRAVGRRQAWRGVFHPAFFVDLKMHGRQSGEQGEDATDRAQVTAPDPFASGEQQPDDDRGDGRTAQNQQRRLGVVIDADQLAVEGCQAERQGWPAAPAQPARYTQTFAVMAGPFAARAFRTQN